MYALGRARTGPSRWTLQTHARKHRVMVGEPQRIYLRGPHSQVPPPNPIQMHSQMIEGRHRRRERLAESARRHVPPDLLRLMMYRGHWQHVPDPVERVRVEVAGDED